MQHAIAGADTGWVEHVTGAKTFDVHVRIDRFVLVALCAAEHCEQDYQHDDSVNWHCVLL